MEHTKELLSVPLASLVPSRYNVRRHTAGQVEELAALIDSQGLLHNLVVTEQLVGRGKARKLKFGVAAGERRRRALLLLQQRGRLPKSHEVICELVPPERALEVSMAENSGREADVAVRFGVSPLIVRRRLKLSAVSPKLLALYRQGGINLDQLMALALSDDHAAQEHAWFDAQPWDRAPAALRRTLTVGEIEAAGNALVRFVGIEAYEGAGGVVRRDLFDDDRSLSNPAVLQRLAVEKLVAIAASVREEGWAWVEARVEVDSHALRQFTPSEYSMREPTQQERGALAELSRRGTELDRQSRALEAASDWAPEEAECIDLEEQDIAARRKAINDDMKVWEPEVMVHSGVIVTVSREGDADVIRGLVREVDRKALVLSQKAAGKAMQRDHGEASHDGASGTDDTDSRAAGCSDSLMRRLSAHRTVALQIMLARNTPVALAALAHAFVQRVFGDEYRRAGSALQIAPQLSAHALQTVADDLEQSPAWVALEAVKLAWKERLPEQPREWLGWLIALPQAEVLNLLALCAASTLNALPSSAAAGEVNVLAETVALDMAEWWEPTAQGYLNHVPKAQIIEALKEAGPDLADDGIGGMKKDVLVVKAASRLAGKRWLPAPLRHLPA